MARPSWVRAALLLGFILAFPAEPVSAASADIAADQGEPLGEIIVTARKSKERLQDVSVTVSVITSDLLSKSSAQDIEDLVTKIPGLSATGVERGQERYSIRGVSSDTGSPTVGTYPDDIPLTSAFPASNHRGNDQFYPASAYIRDRDSSTHLIKWYRISNTYRIVRTGITYSSASNSSGQSPLIASKASA